MAFDKLMNKARENFSSLTVTLMLEPTDAVFLSILIVQEKEIISIREMSQLMEIKLFKYSKIVRAFIKENQKRIWRNPYY